MLELEAHGMCYLFKLKQTKKVKELIALCELNSEWESVPGNWQHCESRLQLTGWNRSRRVVVYRRAHRRKAKPDKQAEALPGECIQGELTDLQLVEHLHQAGRPSRGTRSDHLQTDVSYAHGQGAHPSKRAHARDLLRPHPSQRDPA